LAIRSRLDKFHSCSETRKRIARYHLDQSMAHHTSWIWHQSGCGGAILQALLGYCRTDWQSEAASTSLPAAGNKPGLPYITTGAGINTHLEQTDGCGMKSVLPFFRCRLTSLYTVSCFYKVVQAYFPLQANLSRRLRIANQSKTSNDT
jgi:hypothetical protein